MERRMVDRQKSDSNRKEEWKEISRIEFHVLAHMGY